MSVFANKVVVITGGSEGIGKAMVQAFLQVGAKVATCGRNYDKLYQLQSSYSGQPLMIHTADVSKDQDCENFIQAVVKNFGTIDILINNAGISMRAMFEEVELDAIRKVMDVNFWGTVNCSKFALPYITKNNGNKAICEAISKIGVDGNDKYSKVTNISKIKVDGKLLITKITEDLIKLLSK